MNPQDAFLIIIVNIHSGTIVSVTTAPTITPATAAAATLPLSSAAAPAPLPPAEAVIPRPDQKKRGLPTQWPYIGTREFEPRPSALFTSPQWRAAWQPGGEVRQIYIGQCPGLGVLAKRIAIPLAKLSTTGARNVWARTSELNVDKYAAGYLENGECIIEEGYDTWNPAQFKTNSLPSPESPVTATPRSLIVTLPRGMNPLQFDALFDEQIAYGSIGAWAGTPAGRAHLAALGVPVEYVQRVTAYPGGLEPKILAAREIACFSIRSHVDRLIAIIETILLRYVGLIP